MSYEDDRSRAREAGDLVLLEFQDSGEAARLAAVAQTTRGVSAAPAWAVLVDDALFNANPTVAAYGRRRFADAQVPELIARLRVPPQAVAALWATRLACAGYEEAEDAAFAFLAARFPDVFV